MGWISEVGHAIGDAWSWFTTARVAAAAAAVAVGVAVFTASVGVRTLRQTRRDSKARSRPMLAAELRGVPYSPSQMLVVRNYGPSIARDVQVTFEPPIEMPKNPAGLVTPYLLKRYAAPIPVMTPGMELDNLYFVAEVGEDRKYINREPLPDTVTVKIAYNSDDGEPYSDDFPLDVQLLRQRTVITPSNSPDGRAKQALKYLEEVTRSLESLAETGSLLTREERAQQVKEMTALHEPLRADEGQHPPEASG